MIKIFESGIKIKRKGFTIIEIMVVTLITVMIGAAVLSVLIGADRIFFGDMGLVEIQQKTRQTLDAMSRELRQTESGSIIYTSSSDISFTITDDVSDTASTATYTIRYYYDAAENRIVRENPTTGIACSVTWDSDKCFWLVGDVSELDFCCQGGSNCGDCSSAHTLAIDMTLTKNVRGRDLVFSLMKKVKLRND